MSRLDSIAIFASAGTGKTFALTSRFLALVLAGADPEQILAVTFTRAAAAEILERILWRLAEASRTDKDAAALAQKLERSGVSHPGSLDATMCRRALRRVIQSLNRISIGTIDSFFARIAAAMELELDLPPGWCIADDATDRRLRERAIDELIRDAPPDDTARSVRLLHKGLYSPRVFAAMLDTVNSAYDVFRNSEESAWTRIGPLSPPLPKEPLDRALLTLAAAPLAISSSTRAPHANWAKAHQRALSLARTGDWAEFLKTGLAAKIAGGESTYSRAAISDQVRDAYTPLVGHARAALLSALRDQNLATFDIVRRFDDRYQRLRHAHAACSFDDIPRALLRADAAGDLQHFYYLLDGRFEHALIDEFQDTSVTQFQLLKPLLHEMVCDERGARSIFCVGDVKQSLYQWRNAEPELMSTIRATWDTVVERPMDESHRSSPEIIDAVNRVFSGLSENSAIAANDATAEAARQWVRRFHPHRTVVRKPGSARLVVTRAPEKGDRALQHLHEAARHIAEIARESPGNQIGVLLPRRKNMARLLAELRTLGADATIESGSGVTDSAAVAAVLSLFRLADFPGNSAAAFHVATSPLGPVVGLAYPHTPERIDEVAAEFRRRLSHDGYGTTIAALVRAVRASCDARDLDRLAALVEVGARFDSEGSHRPSEFVAFAAEARRDDGVAAQVRILTVHASKGLQFHTIVLPDLEDVLRPQHLPGVVVERDSPLHPITAVSRYASEEVRAGHERLEAMHRREFVRHVREKFSSLYVAMTRAERRLDMLIRPPGTRNSTATFAALLHAALAPEADRSPGTVLWSRGSPAPPGTQTAPAQQRAIATPAAPGPLELGAPTGRASRLVAMSPSRTAPGRTGVVADALAPRPAEASRTKGTLIHRWLEQVEWLDDSPPSEATLRFSCADAGAEWSEEVAGWARQCLASLKSGAVNDLLTRRGSAARFPANVKLTLFRERPLAARVAPADGSPAHLVVGRIDRLIIASRNEARLGAEIIDFKTSTDSQPDAEIRAAYAPQMEAYRAAMATMLSLPSDRIRCCIALVLQARIVWFT